MINTILQGDVLAVLKTLPDQMVDCVITSPPYWGLRDYGTAKWEAGNPDCDHIRFDRADNGNGGKTSTLTGKGAPYHDKDRNRDPYRDICGKCGAIRIDKQIGLEPTIEEYIEKMTEVFREVRRVLKDTGTLWLNMGDAYAGSWGNYMPTGKGGQREKNTERFERKAYADTTFRPPSTRDPGLKPKDLIGQPWRLALALQQPWLKCKGCAGINHKSKWGHFPNGRLICPCCVKSQGWEIAEPGWYLRSDIIWHKPNPMPESCTDRPTKSHEYVFLMSKKPQYFYDQEAIREKSAYPNGPNSPQSIKSPHGQGFTRRARGSKRPHRGFDEKWDQMNRTEQGANGRNKRTVWTIATRPYPEAHFATFPEKLVEPCIRAGTSERGYCAECGLPWVRVTARDTDEKAIDAPTDYKTIADKPNEVNQGHGVGAMGGGHKRQAWLDAHPKLTIGWQSSCTCDADTTPGLVLDPFFGSGTVGVVAAKNGRNWLGIELNPEYIEMAKKRIPARQEQLIF